MPPLNHQTMTPDNVDKAQNNPDRTEDKAPSFNMESQGNKGAIMNSLKKRVSRSRKMHGTKKKGHLVEQHFKIDKENRALLPGVPSYDDDLARDIHDFFNLIFLVSL